MRCNQCGNEMQKHSGDIVAAPDSCYVYWCDQCGTLARVAPGQGALGRTHTSWSLPMRNSTAKKEAAVNSATSDLAAIIGVHCDFAADEIAALLKRVVDERLREILGGIDASV